MSMWFRMTKFGNPPSIPKARHQKHGLTEIAVATWPLRSPSLPKVKRSNTFLQRHSPDPGWWLAISADRWPTESTLGNRPTSKADNVGYTASPELWIERASSNDRRHKNPDEPASPRARASKAARIQSARLFLKIELDRGPSTEYI